jgi:tRNA1Val (adenine37-N6)-methyltransferase
MKIGTDAVLLGSWVNTREATTVLDIGTGTGILALMMAQRTQAHIDGIEIDQDACEEAKQNAESSPWKDRIKIHHTSFQEFTRTTNNKYDLILSNPPYFANSLKPADTGRSRSRHSDLLSLRDLLAGTLSLLSEQGRATFILPSDRGKQWLNEVAMNYLYPSRICMVFPKEGKPAKRWMLEISKEIISASKYSELIIRDTGSSYTDHYRDLTKDFYLIF